RSRPARAASTGPTALLAREKPPAIRSNHPARAPSTRSCVSPQVARQTCTQALTAPTQIEITQDSSGQVVIGGELQRVHTGAGQALAQTGLALRGDARKTLAKTAVVCVDQLL